MEQVASSGIPDDEPAQNEIVELLFPSFQIVFEQSIQLDKTRFGIDNSILFVNGVVQKMYIEDPEDPVPVNRMEVMKIRMKQTMNVQNILIKKEYQGKKLFRIIWKLLIKLARMKNLYLVISQVQNPILRDALLRYKFIEIDKNVPELNRSYFTKGMRKLSKKSNKRKSKRN